MNLLRLPRKKMATLTGIFEVVKFTDDTYRSLSDDIIITSSSDKKEWCAGESSG